MKLQLERDYRLVIGDSFTGEAVEILPPLNISFKIEKHIDNSSKLNVGKFTIFNLSKETRARFENMKYPSVEFQCGYKQGEGLQTIFIGQATSFTSEMKGADIQTNVEACEAFLQLHSVIDSFTAPQNTSVGAVLLRIHSQMEDIALGTVSTNFKDALGTTIIKKGYSKKVLDKKMAAAYPAEGTPFRLFKSLCKDHGLQWRIDKNTLYFRNSTGDFESPAQDVVNISERTGLIGMPSYKEFTAGGSLKKLTGLPGVTVCALINPAVSVGSIIDVSSTTTQINGFYFIRHIEYVGEYRGNKWYMDIEADEVGRDA